MIYLLTAFLVLIVLLALGLIIIRRWFTELREKSQPSAEIIAWLKTVGERVETSTTRVDQTLTEHMKQFNTRLDKAAFVIAQVQKNIGEFSEIGRSMKDLHDLLQSPKRRGNMGEAILHDMLRQCLPADLCAFQYAFKNGEKVDAIIHTSQGIIPIDAKFPLENFRRLIQESTADQREVVKKEFFRDVKKHVLEIARKYIAPHEGTVDYALMYIPSESVYYEVIAADEVGDYARRHRIILVSPMSLYAYLKVILMSHQGQRLGNRAREMLTVLHGLKKDYDKADEALSTLNRHLTHAYNQLTVVSKFFLSFGQKLTVSHLLDEPEKTQKLEPPT